MPESVFLVDTRARAPRRLDSCKCSCRRCQSQMTKQRRRVPSRGCRRILSYCKPNDIMRHRLQEFELVNIGPCADKATGESKYKQVPLRVQSVEER